MKLITEKASKIMLWSGIGLLFIAVILFFWQDFSFDSKQQIDASKFSQFGDFIGGLIGSIWALAGVILFYVALIDQRTDIATNREVLRTQVNALEKQIEEFKLQRQEMELTRDVYIVQSKTLKKQQFESTFFNSVNLLNNIIENINYVNKPLRRLAAVMAPNQPEYFQIYQGRDSFEYIFEEFKKEYNKMKGEYVMKNIKTAYSPEAHFNIPMEIYAQIIYESYHKFFLTYQSDLGHYFRITYNIIKFVDEKKPEDPKYYTNLVRAQFSTYEHLILFYNCLSSYGKDKFYPLVIKYHLLDNLPIESLLDEEHVNLYPQEAYL